VINRFLWEEDEEDEGGMEETAGSRDGAGLVAPPGEEGGAARVVMSTVLVVTAPSVTLALVGSSGLEGAGECFRATARGATVLAREQQRAGAGGAGADGAGAGGAAGGSTLSDVRVSVADLWADHAADGAGRAGGPPPPPPPSFVLSGHAASLTPY
jgi:hypothetical protein